MTGVGTEFHQGSTYGPPCKEVDVTGGLGLGCFGSGIQIHSSLTSSLGVVGLMACFRLKISWLRISMFLCDAFRDSFCVPEMPNR